MLRWTAAILAFGIAVTPGSAQAQMVQASNPAGIVDVLEAAGYSAELGIDGTGDPKIISSASGIIYNIYFYGCDWSVDCQYLQFSASFDLTNGIPVSRVNEWNADKIAGTAWVDEENDPYLSYFLTTAEGGISEGNFVDVVDWWEFILDDFTDWIDY